MIKSCKDCKSICCKTGPGPYKKLSSEEYLENFGTIYAYNTRCENLVRNRCKVWGTKDLPYECATYVCQNRSYTKQELRDINHLHDSQHCSKCDTPYLRGEVVDSVYSWECIVCGKKEIWKHVETKE